MNHCTTCSTDFEGNFCPHCGKKATKTATVHARRTCHALRLLHFLMLAAFGALVIGLMAAGAFGSYIRATTNGVTETAHLTSTTFFQILTGETTHGGPAFACTVTLLVFAIASVLYGGFLLFTQKTYTDLKYTTILFIYLPVFIIMSAFTAHIRASETITEGEMRFTSYITLDAGGISIFVLTAFFAIAQIVILAVEAHIKKTYLFEDAEEAVMAELGAPEEVPYPDIPHGKDYSKEGQAAYLAERAEFYEKVDTHNANRKERKAFRKKAIAALYQRKFGKQASYPVAYLWWNFSA